VDGQGPDDRDIDRDEEMIARGSGDIHAVIGALTPARIAPTVRAHTAPLNNANPASGMTMPPSGGSIPTSSHRTSQM
jgi:hypothetical protein